MAITKECRDFLDSHFKLESYAGAENIPLSGWSLLFTHPSYFSDDRNFLNKTDRRDELVRLLQDPLRKNEEIEPVWIAEAISELEMLDYFSIYKVMDDRSQSPHFFETYFNDYRAALPRSEFNFQDQASWPRANKYFCERFRSSDWGDPSLKATERDAGDASASSVDLNVNLTFPDDILVKSFKSWLESRRIHAKTIGNDVKKKNKFKAGDVQTWNYYRTLQYNHIMCVQKVFKCELSTKELCNYLFSDRINRYYDTRETEYMKWVVDQKDVMRTVKIHGDMMTDLQNLRMLENACDDLLMRDL